jgi:hypothetical protein
MIYRLYKTDLSQLQPNAATTVNSEPQISFLFVPQNPDYQTYLKWLEEGNQPLPPDED